MKRGFTILELLAVMTIIAILVGLGMKGYSLAGRSAKEGQAKADIEKLRLALEEYRVEFGRYPEQLSHGLGFMTNSVEGVCLVDPWGNDYLYIRTEPFLYSIWSTGQDASNSADDINPSKAGY